MDFMPLFLDIRGKNALVIGGGVIASRKISTLLKYGANVDVVTLEVKNEKIYETSANVMIREFSLSDLNNKFIVVAATDNKEFNSKVSKLCNERNILVNNITTKEDLNCKFAANISNEDYQIAVSARGYPKKAKMLMKKIEEFLLGG